MVEGGADARSHRSGLRQQVLRRAKGGGGGKVGYDLRLVSYRTWPWWHGGIGFVLYHMCTCVSCLTS